MNTMLISPQPRLAAVCERIAVLLCIVGAVAVLSLLFVTPIHFGLPVLATQMLSMILLCIMHAAATKGWRKALGFSAISFAISWFVEFIGCNYSLWFGDYEYTEVLGFSVGNVPLLIVVAWEVIIYPSLLLVDELLGTDGASSHRFHWVAKIAATSLATALVATAWDMMVDPSSVREKWWTWDHGGSYMPDIDGGMPYGNFWGWVGAVFIISALYRLIFTKPNVSAASTGSSLLFAASLYTALFCGMLTNLYYHGLYQPMFIGTFTMGPIIALAWAKLLTRQTQN